MIIANSFFRAEHPLWSAGLDENGAGGMLYAASWIMDMASVVLYRAVTGTKIRFFTGRSLPCK